jgi:hypothetical protein
MPNSGIICIRMHTNFTERLVVITTTLLYPPSTPIRSRFHEHDFKAY